MQAKSIKGSSTAEIKWALEQSMIDGYIPTLAIIFISIKQDRKAVTELFRQTGIDIIGATSCGEFINGYQSEGEAAILLLDLPRHHYAILFEQITDKTIQIAATELAKTALTRFANPSLILCSTGVNIQGEYFDGETLVTSIGKVLGEDKIFYGGMAGDDGTFTGSYIFIHDNETDVGIAALVLNSDKVSMQGMAITGWKPMGISRTITKSAGNLVYTIDNKPAVEMYLKYLGKGDKATEKDFNLLQELSFNYPFIVDRGDGETVIKSPIKIDHTENALLIDMEMPQGSTFWFSTPPDFEIVEEIIAEASELKNFNKADADALLIFSCAGRHPALGPMVTLENEGLAEVWKSPMAGFFTYGEFGRTKNGKQYFHSTACCWVALKEK